MKKWMIGIGLAVVMGISATNGIANNNTVAYQEGGDLMSPPKTKLIAYQEGGDLMSPPKTTLVAYQEGGDLMSPLIPIA